MQQDWHHLGECIKRSRKRKHWLQPELAQTAGLTKRTISSYENGVPPAGAPEIPAGYFAVGRALGWPPNGVEEALKGGDPEAPTAPAEPSLAPTPFHGSSPAELFPGVGRFARAAVAAGGDPQLRDLLEDVADRLLQSVPPRVSAPPTQQSYGLAAYRPHAWAEGDAGVPDDDAERIHQALEEHARRKSE